LPRRVNVGWAVVWCDRCGPRGIARLIPLSRRLTVSTGHPTATTVDQTDRSSLAYQLYASVFCSRPTQCAVLQRADHPRRCVLTAVSQCRSLFSLTPTQGNEEMRPAFEKMQEHSPELDMDWIHQWIGLGEMTVTQSSLIIVRLFTTKVEQLKCEKG